MTFALFNDLVFVMNFVVSQSCVYCDISVTNFNESGFSIAFCLSFVNTLPFL